MAEARQVVCLSIDGVPHALLERLMDEGHMPAMAELCARHGRPRMMRSVQPTVSCVAWASYATARNPGKHGIFGFIDRRPGTYELSLPNASNLRGPNLWEVLSAAGRKVFGMNVPSTYPPRAVNGILIGGFLTPTVSKAAYPPKVNDYLASIDYRIDSDAALARQSAERMLDDLDVTLARRAEAMFHFLARDHWDFFHTHIMGTDRINHFLLVRAEAHDPTFAPAFNAYYRKVDEVIGRLAEAIGDDTPLMIMSDHGFCPITYEVQLARHLIDAGWTTPAEEIRSPLSFDPARSRAYCLIPGRIYVNVAGREPGGIVPAEEYDSVRDQIARDLLSLGDPQGRPVIRKVVRREELYWPEGASAPDDQARTPGGLPPYAQGPDLVAIPHDGYDLKMGLGAPEVFTRTQLEGMHTYDSRAYLLVENNAFGETTATAVAFPSSTPVRVSEEQRQRPGLIEVAYLIGESPEYQGKLRLFRRELAIETDPNQTVIRTTDDGLTLLVDAMTEFYMEFLSAEAIENAQAGLPPQFVDKWESGFGQEALPVAVRVTITMADPTGDSKPVTLERTVRLPTNDVAKETLQEDLEKSLGLDEDE